jgi:hypothetical protein
MPIPQPKENENDKTFMSRCMSDDIMSKEYPDTKQRSAVCLSQFKKSKGTLIDNVLKILNFAFLHDDCIECGNTEPLTISNWISPLDEDYIESDENPEIVEIVFAKYQYRDPITNELYYYDRIGNYKKNNRYLRFEGKAKSSEYQGKKVTLNKPFRTPDGPKKFSVYVKNDKGNVVKVNFGDPNMKIKKNIPERRKSFRARHNCDNPGPKWKARYWSCKAW